MSRRSFDCGPNPEVILSQVTGDLQVRGWEIHRLRRKPTPKIYRSNIRRII